MCHLTVSRKPAFPAAPQELPLDFLDDFSWFEALEGLETPTLPSEEAGAALTASSDSQNSSAVPPLMKPEPAPLQLPQQPQQPQQDLLGFLAQQLQAEGSLQAPAPAAVSSYIMANPQVPMAVAPAPAGVGMPLASTAGFTPAMAAAAQYGVPAAPTPAAAPATSSQSGRDGKPWLESSFAKQFERESMADLIEDPTERMKQKRRESAQRSRARKNAYMKQLEAENRALKEELSRVREQLAALQPCAALPPMPMPAYGSYMVAL